MNHVSPFQFEQRPDGSMGLENFPNITLNTIEGQRTVTGRDWQSELNLPTYWEDWERLARITSTQRRGHVTFVLLDESPTRLPGHPAMDPKQILLPTTCSLELAHTGFVIGSISAYMFGIDGARPSWLDVQLPDDLVGNYILGMAHLFDSPLVGKVLEGLQRGLFRFVCPILWQPPNGPGQALLQVSLAVDYPGCDNAKVLSWSTS